MTGSEAPYLYDPPSSRRSVAYPYSDFNPRAAQQAHYEALAARAEKQRIKSMQGGKPLIDFNAHPDSYMIVANQGPNYEPMPKNTKVLIASTRWVQLAFRIIQEIGALGLLVCFICLKMKLDGQGWVLRIAPAWDSVVCMYAIYHLLRPARGRTPASSGSYHFFSLFMDTGIIPFYVFIVLLANQNYNMDPSFEDRWTSVFTSQHATDLLMFVTYIGGMVLAGLHFVSIGLDLYLIIMFRRIARLPPDMNPLEDNLTRRPSNKHKHKNSEMSASSESFAEKKMGYYSGSTICSDSRSRLSGAKGPDATFMPFGHSRMGSDTSFSAHSPETARLSRQQFAAAGLYDPSIRASRHGGSPDRHSRAGSHSPSKHASLYESLNDAAAQLDARDPLASPEMPHHAQFINPAKKRKAVPNIAEAMSPPRNEPSANWITYDDDDDNEGDMGTPSRRNEPAPAYSRLPMHERHDSFEPNPLKMNPPTPVNAPDYDNSGNGNDNHMNGGYHHSNHLDLPNSPETVCTVRMPPHQQQQQQHQSTPARDLERTNTVESRTSTIQASSIYSDDVPSIRSGSKVNAGTPKGKYYGDLAAATRGVLRSTGGGGGAASPFGRQGGAAAAQQQSPPYNVQQSPRVISRTGVDITDAMGRFESDAQFTSGPRRREVSGKVAEEGRGGGWHSRG